MIWLAPKNFPEPWNLLSPQKITILVFALAMIQVLGALFAKALGTRTGTLLTGFFGGLISSTATTAALARRSRIKTESSNPTPELLAFLAATSAMLLEGIVLVLTGIENQHPALFLIFICPLICSLILIWQQAKAVRSAQMPDQDLNFQVLPLLKLAVFIVLILLVSKILQNLFGDRGLLVLTFFVSLFEIHGSVIANLQLHNSGQLPEKFLGVLLGISIFASYLSKVFLIFTLGSTTLKIKIIRPLSFLALALGFGLATFMISH